MKLLLATPLQAEDCRDGHPAAFVAQWQETAMSLLLTKLPKQKYSHKVTNHQFNNVEPK